MVSLSSSLSSWGDEIERPKAITGAVKHWNLIRTHRPALGLVAVGELETFWPSPLCAAFSDTANTFGCLLVCRKALNIWLFNKSSRGGVIDCISGGQLPLRRLMGQLFSKEPN